MFKPSTQIDPIILGDNQFFGVNHMSQEKGKISERKFAELTEIKKIIHYAMDKGVNGIVFSTHPRIYDICDMIRSDPRLKKELNIYVNLPYIVKYVRMASEMGLYESVKTVFKGQSLLKSTEYFAKSAYAVATSNYLSITNRLVDAELNPFFDLNLKAVFLHNALTDLAIGYQMDNVIKSFYKHIEQKYHAIPAYCTLNYPALCQLLKKSQINNTLIMAAFNKRGFLMNPSRQACEKALHKYPYKVLAMATLASGSIKPDDAYKYLFSLGKIKNVVIGLSSTKHADETFALINQYLKK